VLHHREQVDEWLATLLSEAVVEWVKGTTMTDFQRRLSEALYEQFLQRYRARLFEMVPDEEPFLFTFNRILMWARR
jgi:trans-aconitate 2-methyltransferase